MTGAVPHKLDRCDNCPLSVDEYVGTRVPTFSYAQGRPDVMVVAEAPGQEEDEQGEPLVGSAGRVERFLLDRAQIKSYALADLVRCRPTRWGKDFHGEDRLENRTPSASEIESCLEYLKRDIARLKPKVLLLTGTTTAHAVLSTRQPIVALRRKVHPVTISGHSCSAVVSFNPSIVHYEPDKFTVLQEDHDFVSRVLAGTPHFVPKKRWLYCDTLPKVRRAIRDCEQHQGLLVFDYESDSLARVNVYPFCLGFGYQEDGVCTVYVVPMRHPNSPWSEPEYQEVVEYLRRLIRATQSDPRRYLHPLRATGPVYAAHNAKFETALTLDIFKEPLRFTVCTQQSVHALDENRLAAGRKSSPFGLEKVSESLLGLSPNYWSDRVSDLLYSGRGKELDPREIADHCARDIAVEAALYDNVRERCRREDFKIDRPFRLLSRLPYLLANIERNGMPVDIDYLAKLRSDKSVIKNRLRTIVEDLDELPAAKTAVRLRRSENDTKRPLWDDDYGRFNVRDRDLLHTLFFDVLRLTQDKKTKSGLLAIDKEFLNAHAEGIEEAALVLEYRQLDRLAGTYLESWWKFARQSADNRIRSDYMSFTTNTGRLSSANPGMQQIPTRGNTKAAKETAKAVKRVFRPRHDPKNPRVISSADFSQAEVRWLAEMSGDETLTKLFVQRAEAMERYRRKPSVELWKKIEDHYDLHRQTAAFMNGIKVGTVTTEQRQTAKAICFGVIYGMTIFGLAARLGVDRDEADRLLNLWLNQFPDAREWLYAQEDEACEHGRVLNPIGRVRHLPALLILGSGKSSGAGHMKRVARNAPIQSIASDTTLWVAIQLQDYIDANHLDWQIIGLVHDSIVSELPWADLQRYTRFVRSLAADSHLLAPLGVPVLKVPMEMEVEAGRSYGELIKLSINDVEMGTQIADMEATLLAA